MEVSLACAHGTPYGVRRHRCCVVLCILEAVEGEPCLLEMQLLCISRCLTSMEAGWHLFLVTTKLIPFVKFKESELIWFRLCL